MKLRAYLKAKNVTVAAFAEAIGEPETVVSGWVYQQKQPSLPNAVLVEEATAGEVLPRDMLKPGKRKPLPVPKTAGN
jgi:DNA-binding transcriptional regulator YdaS (Cro superfamily)